MFDIALFGTGKIGVAITAILASSGRYKVRAFDLNEKTGKQLASAFPQAVTLHPLDLSNPSKMASSLKGVQAVVSALPFFLNTKVAELARSLGIHYFDLTEDVETTKAVGAIAQGAQGMFFPQCGLAPGFISIAALSLAHTFESLDTLKLRVGALPQFPSNRLKYNLTWSTDGLINEYCNPGEAIIDGVPTVVQALEGYERFSIAGTEYEAFNTSGGLGSLWQTLQGKVRNLNYKTIRYPGHHELITFLLHELRFIDHRNELKSIFERSIANTSQDRCLIYVEALGIRNGTLMQHNFTSDVRGATVGSLALNAIQVSTASGVCVPLDMTLAGKITGSAGVHRPEEISLESFLSHEFGRFYRSS
ncbi:MAG: saccharopine dehydrogenase C-terminal domain-containing protein [Bdellovibrionota bacterium]|nr:MAG: saccharopine dehydrogenase C-terminal domain-containing protein [Bdellovibrionota bacterium]